MSTATSREKVFNGSNNAPRRVSEISIIPVIPATILQHCFEEDQLESDDDDDDAGVSFVPPSPISVPILSSYNKNTSIGFGGLDGSSRWTINALPPRTICSSTLRTTAMESIFKPPKQPNRQRSLTVPEEDKSNSKSKKKNNKDGKTKQKDKQNDNEDEDESEDMDFTGMILYVPNNHHLHNNSSPSSSMMNNNVVPNNDGKLLSPATTTTTTASSSFSSDMSLKQMQLTPSGFQRMKSIPRPPRRPCRKTSCEPDEDKQQQP